jgi:hypothetical protein
MERIFWLFVQSTLIIVGWKNWTLVGRPVSTKMVITQEEPIIENGGY